MPLVEVDEIISAPVQRVWDVLNDVEAYQHLMDHVRSIQVLEHGSNYRHTSWEVDLKGCIMRWVEREDVDAARYRIDYKQIEGDLAQFEGYWQLEPLAGQTCRAMLTVQFDIGIPMLSEMIDPVAERVIRDNSRAMLLSIGAAAREASLQEAS
jgi:coenzyme Q-binding protein COQ10